MALSAKLPAGPGYVILNVLRAMNIIGFLAVIAASVVMLIKTSTESTFFIFEAVNHVVTTAVSMFLIVSETGLFPGYFTRHWPLLSPEHGLVALSAAMIILGLNILACLNKPNNGQDEFGVQFWRVVISAGIVIFVLGFLNLVASIVFQDRKQRISARQVRAHGAVAVTKASISRSNTSASNAKTAVSLSPRNSMRKICLNTNNDEHTLPSYYNTNPPSPRSFLEPPPPTADPKFSPSSKYSRATWCSKKKLFGRKKESVGPPMPINISAPISASQQRSYWTARPDSALHPSRTSESETLSWKAEDCWGGDEERLL